ncbi:alpha/beta hydrolase [Oleiagrimonas soli]|uniref:Acetyl esterase/lipase n=1 Tax=Oleiagrimonas soli TaxID=1543381 RepID=A0A099CTB3_9GAMM|nr:alpha/beta hydrolase [Oleiagrimonas soli]KGI76994.1 carboxylesterase [Oleiagrimonas soli]MBB6185497.1 acetyl esterase/lipase [Oleiagrimonas soli]
MPSPRLRTLTRLLLAGLLPLCLSACEATFFSALNGVTPRRDVRVHRCIVFDRAHRLALDVYRPVDATHAPVVVFFYGGAWQDGKRQWYRWAGKRLARQGLVVVVPDYRKFPQVKLDGFMHDAARAVAWTHAHAADYGGDPDDLFLMGHSAGAHIGALLATDETWLHRVGMRPRQLRGFIGLAGPYDFLPLREQVYIDLFGATHAQQMRSQPVAFVDGNEPPMLLLQGGDDGVVAPDNALSLAAALREHGEQVQAHVYSGVSHAGLLLSLSHPFRSKAPTLHDALRFIDAHSLDARAVMATASTSETSTASP